ncbi:MULTISPECIES: MerR family transcriptional regulator [unclassified Streptomyces]|jgi:MerR family redox-sensitive transcriptional activator SoxR|uniref:MerR family transcriptional regulator n=1 Tax=unclassified Streptomyces TaxID=2593676 RepID=UPI000F4E6FEE|nr:MULTISPECIES: MerR family transcriptional regulator [unclassified Streptomyces]MDH6454872.1 MerR family redox-sensitive transcriptional activator SoxR [Streptomyces sp. SAI-119]MDH6494574.1 MerR family redox-sensitive transcriptional activator SoxR [Streptomyces sp. SAI-149]QUC58289.1 MerR family DNA-binding transcriptional regulator [Streptomyces sp. A2-16]
MTGPGVTGSRTEPTLTVSGLAQASGVAASAVRFYDNHGLIPSVRTTGNQRRFYEIDSCLVKIIRVAQRVGLSVAEIRDLLADLPDRPDITIEDWYHLRHRLEDEVRIRIEALTSVLDDLTTEDQLCDVPPLAEHERRPKDLPVAQKPPQITLLSS